jgi:hypothetical protein
LSVPVQSENTVNQRFIIDASNGSTFRAKDTSLLYGGARLASGEKVVIEGGHHENLEISNASLAVSGSVITGDCSFNNTLRDESVSLLGSFGLKDCTFWGGVAVEMYDNGYDSEKGKGTIRSAYTSKENNDEPIRHWKVFALRYWAKEIQGVQEGDSYHDESDLMETAQGVLDGCESRLQYITRLCLAPNTHSSTSCLCGIFLPYLLIGDDLAVAYFVKANPALADAVRGTIFESLTQGQIKDVLLSKAEEDAGSRDNSFSEWWWTPKDAFACLGEKLRDTYGLGSFSDLLRAQPHP